MARTRSIIYIIRRYGLSSRRLSPKYPIKYEDAIKGLESYENGELKIVDVIDNVLFPARSVSNHCQVPGCNHPIRYEYVLENKVTKERFVAGSTCVWPTLGMSELQKKEFLTYEGVVKEYHAMLWWRNANPDVVEKIEKAQRANLNQFRPFWQEIDHSPLLDEDTEYIRNTDMDAIIAAKEEREKKAREWREMSQAQREQRNAEYQKVLTALDGLIKADPKNEFYASLKWSSERGRLTDKQIRCIKVDCNKRWFKTNVEPNPVKMAIYKDCDIIVRPILDKHDIDCPYTMSSKAIQAINAVFETLDSRMRLAWNCFKVKHEIVA